ncbi:methyltransferase domain-containing protein [Nonomuraea rhizosphaerae]|uniref:methyltransferase domain-containing protein n=1 Tax=Nonomuraea rhizosphaerae TaxID=2665663 RepID=UPI001C5D3EEF|nr:methyltransferase domain-containing protein [Nonomuraea rhizosphaerae]
MIDIAGRTEALIAEVGVIVPVGDRIRAAFHAIPRHRFIPARALAYFGQEDVRLIDRDADPASWWDAVYSDTSLVTQLDDGATHISAGSGDYTSSASAPSTVTSLLRRLDVEPGQRVLEVGTGTGWTAALLSHLAGERGSVTSIEVDPQVARQAAKNLSDVGVSPHLVVADGGAGHPRGRPYDRVHVTCGVRDVPYAWIEQSRPGGVIVLPYCPGFGSGHELRLVVTPDGSAYGRFPGSADYMMMRSQRDPADRAARTPGDKHHLTTRVDPRTIAFAPAGADLAITALTGLTSESAADHDEDGEVYRLWLSDPADPYSWAVVDWRPEAEEYEVYQVGDRPLWGEVSDAYFRWVRWGEPHRDRFGMTVTGDGQRIWLDEPARVLGPG